MDTLLGSLGLDNSDTRLDLVEPRQEVGTPLHNASCIVVIS